MKQKIKQIVSLMIASLLAFSTPIQSLAVETEKENQVAMGGNGGGNSSSGVAIPAGDFGTDYTIPRIGLRISVVRKDKPEEMLMPYVIDITYMNSTNFGDWYNSCGSKYSNNWFHKIGDKQPKVKLMTIYGIANAMEVDSTENGAGHNETNEYTIPRWMNYIDGFKGRGDVLNSWLIKNESGEVANNTNLTETVFDSNGHEITLQTVSTSSAKSGSTTAAKAATANKTSANKATKAPSNKYTTYNGRITCMANRYINAASQYGTATKTCDEFSACGNRLFASINLYVSTGEMTSSEADNLKKLYRSEQTKISNWMTANLTKKFASANTNKNTVLASSLFDKMFNTMTVYAATTTDLDEDDIDDILSGDENDEEDDEDDGDSDDGDFTDEELNADGEVTISESTTESKPNESTGSTEQTGASTTTGENGETVEVDKYGTRSDAYIKRLFYIKENGKYLFSADGGTTHISEMTETNASGQIVPIDYILVMEPIVMFTPTDTDGHTAIGLRVYGTLSNIAEHWELLRLPESHLNTKAMNISGWSAMTLSDSFEFGDRTLTVPKSAGQVSFAELRKRKANNEGWGLHLYWGDAITIGSSSKITTWDSEKFPNGYPGAAPDASDDTKYPKEDNFGDKSKKFNIVKWYYLEDELAQTETVFDVKTRKDTPHTVAIVPEGDRGSECYWEVVDWQTGKENIVPADGDTNSTYEEYCNKNLGAITGNGPAELKLEPTDPDQVLYVKLKLSYMETKIDVVKVIDTPDGKVNVTEEEIENTVKSYNAKESTATVKEWTISPYTKATVTKWDDVPTEDALGYGTSDEISLADKAKTIYIHYSGSVTTQPEISSIALFQNELSHVFTTNDISPISGYTFEYLNKYSTGRHRVGSRPNRWTCYWETEYTDDSYKISIKNNDSIYNGSPFIGYTAPFAGQEIGKIYTDDSEREPSLHGFTTIPLLPVWKFVLYRDKTKDLVTLYPNKNDQSVINELLALGITKISSIPSGTRIAKESEQLQFNNSFKVNYVDSGSDKTLKYTKDHDCSRKPGSVNQSYMVSTTIEAMNNIINSRENNTTTLAFLGKTNSSLLTPPTSASTITIASKQFTQQKACKVSNISCSFYPYTKMVYETLNTPNNAYVTSENQSTVGSSNRVETAFYRKNPSVPNLNLTSTQLSDGRLWEVLTARYFSAICLPDCKVMQVTA